MEGEGKKAVTEEGALTANTTVLVGFWRPTGKSLLSMPETGCASSRSTRERKAVRMFSMLHFSPLENELCSVT